jgi:DNA-binding NarL/FixJ family response regulator
MNVLFVNPNSMSKNYQALASKYTAIETPTWALLLAESCSNQEISKRTGLSIKSVERWIDRIYQELEIESSGAINPRVAAVTKYLAATGASDKR